MYNVVELEENVRVPPYLFKMERDEAIRELLREKYKGRVLKDVGLVIDIVEARARGTGVVIPGDAYVYYKTHFKMLTFTVETGEVFRGIVRDVVDFGAFINIGPLEGLLHISQIGKEKFMLDRKNRVLHNVKKDKTLKKGDVVFVKVSTVSMKGALQDVKIGLSMRGLGLGKLDWLKEEAEKGKAKGW